ncbi:MAG: dipeptidyl aminopeptidase [Isosphaera sp.]|nr:dipeptidyl aminopeptidase [Isosphaera sp.]
MRAVAAGLCWLVLPAAAAADDFPAQRDKVVALGKLTDPPKVHPADGFKPDGGLRPLFFDGLPYKGKPTRVFAWYGVPEKRTGKVPAVVLVHGGGGTAYTEWVKRWTDHGFAAISIAVEGQTDRPAPAPARWERHAWPGPARVGIYGDAAEPLADQWMYHAAADTILAHSLLRSFPEVDPDKVGVVGISWGGVITATVMGIDNRFAFAVPVYGGGYLTDAVDRYQRALKDNKTYREVWEPGLRLSAAKMPALWLTWLRDPVNPLDVQRASYRAAGGPRMVAVLPDMKHSHPAGWAPEDSYAFAAAVVKDGKPWLREVSRKRDGDKVAVEWAGSKKPDRAVLWSTADSGFTGERKWVESAAELAVDGEKIRVTAALPAGTRAYFVNLHVGKLTASSEYEEAKP